MVAGERYRIDFIHQSKCIVPNNSVVNIPGVAVNNIYIRNNSENAFVQWYVNAPSVKEILGTFLAPGVDRNETFYLTNVKSVNLIAYDGVGSVSLEVFI